MRIVALLLGAVAVGYMIAAIAGMITRTQSERVGWALRVAAVLCFAGAVVLNAIARQ